MSMNFNDAEPQKTGFGELIPDNTIVTLVASLRPGSFGDGGWLKNNNDGTCLMLDFEFTIDGGPFDRRKVWGMYVTEGETEGQQKAAAISRSLLRAMLESAHGVDPSDDSPAAQTARQVDGWGAFDGLRFCARLGTQKGNLKDKTAGPNSEKYADKNILREAVTPDNPKYVSPGAQAASQTVLGQRDGRAMAGAAQPKNAAAAKGGSKPAWAS